MTRPTDQDSNPSAPHAASTPNRETGRSDDDRGVKDNPAKRHPAHVPAQDDQRDSMHHTTCPNCGKAVLPTAVACPDCGEKVFVEHPADMKRVRNQPLDLPAARPDTYGP